MILISSWAGKCSGKEMQGKVWAQAALTLVVLRASLGYIIDRYTHLWFVGGAHANQYHGPTSRAGDLCYLLSRILPNDDVQTALGKQPHAAPPNAEQAWEPTLHSSLSRPSETANAGHKAQGAGLPADKSNMAAVAALYAARKASGIT